MKLLSIFYLSCSNSRLVHRIDCWLKLNAWMKKKSSQQLRNQSQIKTQNIILCNLVHWKEFLLAVSVIYFSDTLGEPNALHSTNIKLPLKRNFSKFAKGIQPLEPFCFLQYHACGWGNLIFLQATEKSELHFVGGQSNRQRLLQVPYPESNFYFTSLFSGCFLSTIKQKMQAHECKKQ